MPPRSHPTRQLLTALHEGMLGPEAQAHWRAHVAACSDCGAQFAALESLDAALAATPPVEVPFDFAAGVMAALPTRRAPVIPPAAPFALARESVGPLTLALVGVPFLALLLERGSASAAAMTWAVVYGFCAMAVVWSLPLVQHPPHLRR
ncbi:MAG TPA: hypothetical protein VEI97_01235 [bacterium]|nr:hypothetical protein [bacterium]